MKKFWWNDYIGIPYKGMASDIHGCDCWGLVRLVYHNEFGIDIPEVPMDAASYETHGKQCLIPMGLDALWDRVNDPMTGDVISFNILGHEQHVGVVTTPGYMLHTFNAHQTSCIEPYTARKWKNRIAGIYRYAHSENALPTKADGIAIVGKPHPLKKRITDVVTAGKSLQELIDFYCDQYNVPVALRKQGAACVNLRFIPQDQWATTYPTSGDTVIFRIHGLGGGGGNPFKAILGVVLIVVATALTWYAGGTGGAAVAGALGISETAAMVGMAVVAIGLTIAGMALLNNSIASKPQLPEKVDDFVDGRFLGSGNNANRVYETLPQVLGIGRMVFDYLGRSYTEQEDQYTNYLRAIFTAGYGPVEITDIRNGDTPLTDYNDIQLEVHTGNGDDQTPRLYTVDPDEVSINVTLDKNVHNRRTTGPDVDQIQIVLYWPQGLWYRNDRGDKGNITNTGNIKIRRIEDVEWQPLQSHIRGASFVLPACCEIITSSVTTHDQSNTEWQDRYGNEKHTYADQKTWKLYRWHTFTVDRSTGNIRHYAGGETDRQNDDPSPEYLDARYAAGWTGASLVPRLAVIPATERVICHVCVCGSQIIETLDLRKEASIRDCAITSSNLDISFGEGVIENAAETTWSITKYNEVRAFTRVFTIDVPRGQYEVDVELTSADDKEKAGWDGNAAVQVQWLVLRQFTFRQPFRPRKPLAWFETRIRATNQISGQLNEINGAVASIVLDYDYTTDTWIRRPSNNPASLFRHVLQGPAIADEYRIDDSHIDLQKLKDWHNYCRIQGFTFFKVVGADSGLSIYDILVQIASAGYAKPVLKPDEGGVWTVWVDEPQTTVMQHFTDHNTWGAQWTKRNVAIPHAIRATFINEEKDFERDTVTVYVDGHTESDATKFENWGIEYFEGVTNIKNVQRICKRALAYAKLRPESLSFMCAMEYLTSQNGDLVRVTNSFVQWGLSSGWVVSPIMDDTGNAIGLVLSETVTLTANEEYSIRVRRASARGTSFKTDIAVVDQSVQTNEIRFTAPVAQGFPEEGDLYQFGYRNRESHECLIESIVPESGDVARVTVCDYSPELYEIDDGKLPAYDAGISRPQQLPSVIVSMPEFVRATSDESVILLQPDGTMLSRIAVTWARPQDCQPSVAFIQFRYRVSANGAPSTPSDPAITNGDPAEASSWDTLEAMALENTTVFLMPVEDDWKYDIEARFVTRLGTFGQWKRMVSDYQVVGKTTLPPVPDMFNAKIVSPVGILLSWGRVTVVDFHHYEIRGDAQADVTDTQVMVQVANKTGDISFTLHSVDTGGRKSTPALTASVHVDVPKTPSVFEADTRTDGLYLTWENCDTTWPIQHYIITDPYLGNTSNELRTQTVISPRAVGLYKIDVQAVDIFGNVGSAGRYNLHIIQPEAPVASTSIDNGVVRISWSPVKSSFPIRTYQLYTVDGQLLQETNSTFYDVNGPSGILEYRVRAIDTAGNASPFGEVVLRLAPPSIPEVTASLNKNRDAIDLHWTAPSSMLPIIAYDVIRQWDVRGEQDYGRTDSTVMSIPPLPAGTHMFMVRAVDASGAHGTWGTYEFTVRAPGAAFINDINVIDNNVQLYWQEPENQFFAIAYYNFSYVEDGYAALIGRIDARFASRFEHKAGDYTYQICPVDVAGNIGKCSNITARVAEPPDFIIYTDITSTFGGERINCSLNGEGEMLMPVDPDVTWDSQLHAMVMKYNLPREEWTWDRKIANGDVYWQLPPAFHIPQTWNDNVLAIAEELKQPSPAVTWTVKHDAGYPHWDDPSRTGVLTEGVYIETVDTKVIIPVSKVSIIVTKTVLEPLAKMQCRIEVSQDTVHWTELSRNSYSGYASAFRYIRFTLTVTDGLIAISNINIRVDVKKLADFGSVNSGATDNDPEFISIDETPDLYGTYVPFNVNFTDVQSGPLVGCNERGKTAYASFKDTLRPSGFRVFVLDADGNRVDGRVSWNAHGI